MLFITEFLVDSSKLLLVFVYVTLAFPDGVKYLPSLSSYVPRTMRPACEIGNRLQTAAALPSPAVLRSSWKGPSPIGKWGCKMRIRYHLHRLHIPERAIATNRPLLIYSPRPTTTSHGGKLLQLPFSPFNPYANCRLKHVKFEEVMLPWACASSAKPSNWHIIESMTEPGRQKSSALETDTVWTIGLLEPPAPFTVECSITNMGMHSLSTV